jgi:transposase
MARTAQISKEKRQSSITLRLEGQSMWKISRTFKVSSSTVAKTIKLYDETGAHDDHHRKGRPRVTSAAEDKFIRVTSLRNCSLNKCFTDFK